MNKTVIESGQILIASNLELLNLISEQWTVLGGAVGMWWEER